MRVWIEFTEYAVEYKQRSFVIEGDLVKRRDDLSVDFLPWDGWRRVWKQEARATSFAFLCYARRRFPRDVCRIIARHIWDGRAEGPGVWGPGFV
jgi:hypothetical protein